MGKGGVGPAAFEPRGSYVLVWGRSIDRQPDSCYITSVEDMTPCRLVRFHVG